MKKNYMNIVAQEVTKNGERVLRYKGSDGKFHDVAPDGGGTVLSVEDITRTLTFGNASLQGSMQIADFLMRYGSCKITAFEIGSIRRNSSSANKIYFDNSVLGSSPCYYDLTNSAVLFYNASNALLDQLDRTTYNNDDAAVKEFFERTVAMKIGQITPYNMYYFMVKSSFIIAQSRLTVVQKQLVGTDKDGTRHVYGVIAPYYY